MAVSPLFTSLHLPGKTATKLQRKNVFLPNPSPREILDVDHFLIREAAFIWREELSHSAQNNAWLTQETGATQSSDGAIYLVPWEGTEKGTKTWPSSSREVKTGPAKRRPRNITLALINWNVKNNTTVQCLASRGHCEILKSPRSCIKTKFFSSQNFHSHCW